MSVLRQVSTEPRVAAKRRGDMPRELLYRRRSRKLLCETPGKLGRRARSIRSGALLAAVEALPQGPKHRCDEPSVVVVERQAPIGRPSLISARNGCSELLGEELPSATRLPNLVHRVAQLCQMAPGRIAQHSSSVTKEQRPYHVLVILRAESLRSHRYFGEASRQLRARAHQSAHPKWSAGGRTVACP